MNLHIRNLVKRFIPDQALSFLRFYRSQIKLANGPKRSSLLQFEVHLADHCNLNCKSCSHFSPLAEENFMEIDDFRHDCERLGKLTGGQIQFIRFMGGEPLLHNQIIEFLDAGRNNFPKGELIIVTNGILLPKQSESFWENCQKNNVEIEISNYPIKIDRDKINVSAGKYKVTVDYVGGKEKIMWRAMKLDMNGRQNIKENFGMCSQSNTCIHLNKGRLFTCPVTAYIQYFNGYFGENLQITKDDYIDIYKAENIDEILDFLCKPIPFCRYCNVKEEKNIKWAVSEKDIQEWS
ncbi:MAG: 4Fe-4S cluster-binding domain-containing protein [Treponema sp.]|nr:4Fe-4S cluster-binding domain-containing protein [Treponema sp.]